MACPTCSHTLAGLANGFNDCAFWHCDRCGTAVVTNIYNGAVESAYVPKAEHAYQWKRLGIAEAIHTESERAVTP